MVETYGRRTYGWLTDAELGMPGPRFGRNWRGSYERNRGPHQEINASDDEPLSCVLVRSGQEPVVVNLDISDVEPNPENVRWIDNIHAPQS